MYEWDPLGKKSRGLTFSIMWDHLTNVFIKTGYFTSAQVN